MKENRGKKQGKKQNWECGEEREEKYRKTFLVQIHINKKK